MQFHKLDTADIFAMLCRDKTGSPIEIISGRQFQVSESKMIGGVEEQESPKSAVCSLDNSSIDVPG